MYLKTDIAGKEFITLQQPETFNRLLGKGQVFVTEQKPRGLEVSLSDVIEAVQSLAAQANTNFVRVEEMVEVFIAAMLTGEPAMVIGEPGTAKTAIGRFLAHGLSANLFTVVMNPDLTRENLTGPIDPVAYSKDGVWRRKWSGLATAHLAIVDELGQASGQNANLFLNAFAERLLYEGDETRQIPLVSAMIMTNDMLTAPNVRALNDRLLFRHEQPQLTDLDDIKAMLTSDADTILPNTQIPIEALKLVAALCEYEAIKAPENIVDMECTVLGRLMSENLYVGTGRRQRQALKALFAYAHLLGETPHPEHGVIWRYIFWNELSKRQDAQDLIVDTASPTHRMILNLRAKVEILEKMASNGDYDNFEFKLSLSTEANSALNDYNNLGRNGSRVSKANQGEIENLVGRIRAVHSKALGSKS